MLWRNYILPLFILIIFANNSYTQCSFSISPDAPLCKLSPITFMPEETKGLSYMWIFGDGDTSMRKNPIHVYDIDASSAFTVTLFMTDTLMNTSTCSQTITLSSASSTIQATGDTLECDDLTSPDSIFTSTFTITSGGGGNFIWDWGDGSSAVTSASLTESHTYTKYGVFYLTLTKEGEHCPSFVQRIRSYGQPLSEIGDPIGGIDNTLCEGESICLWNESDLSNGPIDFFVWTWRNGVTDTVFDANPRCFQYTYEDDDVTASNREFVVLESFNECFTEDTPEYAHLQTTQITIFALPRAKFDAPDVVCIVDSTICFENLSFPRATNRPYEYEWSFGDPASGVNNTSDLFEPCHTFSRPGTYPVRLVVKNGCGADTMWKEIDILPQPIADAKASDTAGCRPLIVNFENLSTPLATSGHFVRYDWKVSPETGFVIDSSANFFEPTITFLDSGKYKVTLIVVTECDSVTWCDSIIVGRPPTVAITPIADTCNQAFILPEAEVNSFGLPIFQYRWTFRDGNPRTQSIFPLTDPVFFGAGSHEVILEVANECGSGTYIEPFTVASLETVEAGPDLTVCVNAPIALGGTPSGGRWEGEGVDMSGVFTPPGIGTFMLYYKVGGGECEVADSTLMTVIGAPDVTIFSPDTAICQGSSAIPLQVSEPGGTWNSSFVSSDIFNPEDSIGEFVLVYTLTNSQTSCSGSDTLIITVNPLPRLCVQDTSFCLTNDNLQLMGCANISGTETWQGAGTSNDGLFNPSLAGEGIHEILYTFTTSEGCSLNDTLTVSVFSATTIDAGPVIDSCRNASGIELTNFTPLGGRWNITGENLNDSTFLVNVIDVLALPNQTLIYTIGSGSCEVSDSIQINILDTAFVNAGDDLILCEDARLITLVNQTTPSGGIFTGPGMLDPHLGTFDPRLVFPGNTYGIHYTFEHANSCISRDIVNILVDTLPRLAFVLPQDSCVDAAIPLTNFSTNTQSCSWDFGDGNTSQACNPTHTYVDTGTYVVQLIGTSANQCSHTLSDTITIYRAPLARFTKDVDSLCADGNGVVPVNFTNLSDPAGGVYLWDFGNGDTSRSAHPGTVFFEQDTCPTTYHITLTIINECGIHSMRDSVKVLPRPQLRWGTNVSTGCSPLLIKFNNVSVGKPESFEWFVNDLPFSNDSIPDSTYFFAQDRDSLYTILLVGENSCGTDSLTHTLTVKPNTINPFFNTSITEGCAPLAVQFTDYSNATHVSWDFGDGRRDDENSPLHIFEEAGTYLVQMFANNGCSYDTGMVEIKVFPSRPAEFSAPAAVCLGDTVDLQPLNTDLITAYIWDFGDGDSSGSINPSHWYDAPGRYTVTLTTIADSLGCANSWDTTVLIRALPPAYFSISDTSGCAPHAIVLDGVPNLPELFYDWDLGDGNSSTLPIVNHVYENAGDYTIHLTVTDNFECKSDTTAQVHVHPLPQSAFSQDRVAYCGQDTVYFQNESANAMGWEWDFGDGTFSTLRNPTKIYDAPSVYEVELISFNRFNCTDTTVQIVEILPQSVAKIMADTLQGCFPFEVIFTNGSENYSHSFWNFGDGTTSILQHPGGHTFFGADQSYSVTLVVDTAGFCPDTTSIQIEVGSWPISSFEVSVDEACEQATILFSNTSHTDSLPLRYEWQRNNVPFFNQAQPDPMLLTTGIYEILLIVTNAYGCKDSASHTVRIHPQPVAAFAASDTLGCGPLAIDFNNLSSNFSHSRWELAPNIFSPEINPSYTYELSDDSLVVELIVDTAGFCFDTARQKIVVANPPSSDFEVSDLIGCSELAVTLTSLSQSSWRPISLGWNLDGGNPPFSTDSMVQATLSATEQERIYRIIHRVTNDWGCSDSSSQEVRVYPQPMALFQAFPDSGCSPLRVRFENLSEDFTGSFWDFGDGIVHDTLHPEHLYIMAGDYDVTLIVNYAEICWDSLTVNDLIHVEQSPIADFTYQDSLPPSGVAKGYVSFTNGSSFANNYVWDFGDGNSSNEENPVHQYGNNIFPEVKLIAYAANRCTDTSIHVINFESFGKLYIPNALAPEYPTDTTKGYTVFFPKGIGLAEYEIAIYTRWGTRIWHSTALDDRGKPAEWWDGQGFDHPEVFIWKVHKAIFENGDYWQGPREGSVTLIR